MKLNRRNVLVGLGTIVAGGGAAIGTGAFSSVEAQRSVEIDTAGDETALIGIDVTGDLEGEDDGEDMIEFDLEESLNVGAVTRFNGALTITNNREDSGDEVDIDIKDGEESLVVDDATDDGGLQFEVENSDTETGVSGDGGTVTFNIVFGLTDQTTTGGADDEIPDEITIEATDA